MFCVLVNSNLMLEHVIQTKSGTTANVKNCKKLKIDWYAKNTMFGILLCLLVRVIMHVWKVLLIIQSLYVMKF